MAEHSTVFERAVAGDIEDPHVALSAVGDQELLLIRSEGDSVGPLAIARGEPKLTLTIDVKDSRELVDGRSGVGVARAQHREINAAVDRVDDIVRTEETFAFELVDQDSDLAVLFGPRDTIPLARQQPALVIEREAVGAVAALAKYFRGSTRLPLHNPVTRNIGEQHVAAAADNGPFGEFEAACNFLYLRSCAH